MKTPAATTGRSYGLGWRLVVLAGFFSALTGLAILVFGVWSGTSRGNDLAVLSRLAVRFCEASLVMSGITVAAIAWYSLRNGRAWASKFLWFMALWAGVNSAVALAGYRFGTGIGIVCAMAPLTLATWGLLQEKKDRALLATPTLDMAPQFQDERFEQPGDWVMLRQDNFFTQRYLRSSKPVLCETIMTTRGDAAQAIALLRGAWDWWGRSYAFEFNERADGSTDQILIPVDWYWCHVRMRFRPPVGLAGGGWRLPANLAGSFEGPASFDVYAEPGTDRLTIRGRFHGIADNVPIFWQDLVTRSHLWAESGILPPPFPKGTGWAGLGRLLETKCRGEGGADGGGKARSAGVGAG